MAWYSFVFDQFFVKNRTSLGFAMKFSKMCTFNKFRFHKMTVIPNFSFVK